MLAFGIVTVVFFYFDVIHSVRCISVDSTEVTLEIVVASEWLGFT